MCIRCRSVTCIYLLALKAPQLSGHLLWSQQECFQVVFSSLVSHIENQLECIYLSLCLSAWLFLFCLFAWKQEGFYICLFATTVLFMMSSSCACMHLILQQTRLSQTCYLLLSQCVDLIGCSHKLLDLILSIADRVITLLILLLGPKTLTESASTKALQDIWCIPTFRNRCEYSISGLLSWMFL